MARPGPKLCDADGCLPLEFAGAVRGPAEDGRVERGGNVDAASPRPSSDVQQRTHNYPADGALRRVHKSDLGVPPNIVRLVWWAILAVLLTASLASAEPPGITAVVPAGGQRGQQVEVTIQGKLGTPPLSFWSNRPELQAEFPDKPDKGFTLSIPESTPPGLAFLRVYNAEGSSALRPFIIGTLPEVAEVETNNSLSQAQTLDTSQVTVNGALGKNGDVDTFAVSLEKGQTLVAAMTSNRDLGSPMDGVLQIVSAKGFVLEQNDDDRGNDPLIAFEAPETGTYFVRTFGFPATPNSSIRFSGGADWIYRLTLTTGPYVDHIQPLAVTVNTNSTARAIGWNLPDQSRSIPVQTAPGEFNYLAEVSANPVVLTSVGHPVMREPFDVKSSVASLPVTLSGHIAEPGEIDSIRFEGKKGAEISITAEARAIGSQLDPVLRLTDADGNQLAEQDDASRDERDAVLSFTPKADGPVILQILDRFEHGGERYFYRVTVEVPQSSYRLSVAADAFKLDADKPLEIPVTVDRDRGFNAEVQVTVQGLPEGMTAEPVVSEAKGDSSKKVTLKLERGSIDSFSGAIQITGTSQGEKKLSATATIAVAGTANRSHDLWLTVPAKPEPKEEPEGEKK